MPDAHRRRVPTRDPLRGKRFGALLTTRRKQAGLTIREVSELSGVAHDTIQRWCSGQSATPYPEHLHAVCRVLGIDQRDALLALGYLQPETAQAA